jgi:NADPH-dependent 2,4-dienoyl-CoA reductase/sulfur reductase-like enzyme/nitrite reductase/ring-hydroxylating ferredoxin subunit
MGAGNSTSDQKPRDLSAGVPLGELTDGVAIAGRIGDDDVILIRQGAQFFCVGASCTHYHGALADGLVVDDTVHCPLHHACFSLRTGEALGAPALDPLPCWGVECVGDVVFARGKRAPEKRIRSGDQPSSIVIVGGGAAGLAAADMLRRDGYQGELTMLSADADAPVDRPNLSKDFLAGTAPSDWMPLRPDDFYTSNDIKLKLDSRVSTLDTRRRLVQAGGAVYSYDALLLATGAAPVRLDIPGADQQVCYLRSFADSRAIVARAASAKSVIVVGSSFIGLEVAASLRARGIAVHVVGRESLPLEKVLGPEVGRFIQAVHEQQGVTFHLGQTIARVDGRRATLSGGKQLEADFIVVGVGVRPSVSLAEQAGLSIDRGISVNRFLETSAPNVYAAGDAARWPDPHSGEPIRVEHWVVAQRQGQVAARNMLGGKQPFDAVPFFWSQHYDTTIRYVGHAEHWDEVEIDGALESRDCAIRYVSGGRALAVATIGRDLENLRAELELAYIPARSAN